MEENKLAIEHLLNEINNAAEMAVKTFPYGISDPVVYKMGFETGAKWMIENIFKFITITD